MALKQCPFWVIAGIIPDYSHTVPIQGQSFSDAVNEDFNVFRCKGEKCQMWNPSTQDCGLKYQTPSSTPILNEGETKPDFNVPDPWPPEPE